MAHRLDLLFLPPLKEHFAGPPIALIYIKSHFQPIKGKYAKGRIFITSLKLIVAVFFLSILPAQVHALTPDQVFDKVKDAVVVVKTLDAWGKVKGQGNGVLISSGRVATNCHVVEGGASYQVGRGKELVRATLYAEDPDKDICLLDAKGITGKPAQLGKAAGLKMGVPVYAVGAPQGLELSLSGGIVAQLRGGPPPFIQTTAAISPGSSGGGLFDGEGRLVGLITLYVEGGQSLNFAIPVEWIGEIKPSRKPAAEGRSLTEWLKGVVAIEEMKDWHGLLDWCLKWTKSDPKNGYAWSLLGVAYSNLNRYDDAIKAYRQALRIDPEYANAWVNLGVTYSNLNRYDDAIEAFRQALRIDPKDAGAWVNLGVAYRNLNRYDDAIEAYRQALRIDPKDAGAWVNLGVAYRNLNRYDDAIEAYRQALRIDPEYALAWYNLGIAYRNLNRYDDAIKANRQALRIDPEYANAWYNLGIAYRNLNRYDDAIKAFRQALRIDPKDADAWYNLGIAYRNLNRYDDAIKAYRQALRIDPKDADAWYNLGIAYALSGNRTAALEVVQKLRRLDPEGADKLFNLIVPR
jgi:tetratricopeptide (TPR) repeat protein